MDVGSAVVIKKERGGVRWTSGTISRCERWSGRGGRRSPLDTSTGLASVVLCDSGGRGQPKTSTQAIAVVTFSLFPFHKKINFRFDTGVMYCNCNIIGPMSGRRAFCSFSNANHGIQIRFEPKTSQRPDLPHLHNQLALLLCFSARSLPTPPHIFTLLVSFTSSSPSLSPIFVTPQPP